MLNRIFTASLLCAVALSFGCTLTMPRGWPEVEHEEMSITLEDASSDRHVWALAGGEQIVIDIGEEFAMSNVFYTGEDFDFIASYRDMQVRCTTSPDDPDMPEARFGCFSLNHEDPMYFWVGELPGCDITGAAGLERTATHCRNGTLIADGERYELSHTTLEGVGAAVNWATWTSADERDNMSVAMKFESPCEVTFLRPERFVPVPLQRRLFLMSVAHAYFTHATSEES